MPAGNQRRKRPYYRKIIISTIGTRYLSVSFTNPYFYRAVKKLPQKRNLIAKNEATVKLTFRLIFSFVLRTYLATECRSTSIKNNDFAQVFFVTLNG